jgi:hypothetical protein
MLDTNRDRDATAGKMVCGVKDMVAWGIARSASTTVRRDGVIMCSGCSVRRDLRNKLTFLVDTTRRNT